MRDSGVSPYDVVPYPGNPFQQTHPDSLATVAHLYGMQPAPVDRCRVLELGCGEGANLLPMAYALPESRFVGLDLSGVAIERGRRVAAELGLANIDLLQADLRAVPAQLGEFDYILCHGVYSWVPSDAQDAILALCQRRLAPQGVAYVSYNAYPGSHMRQMLREMLLFHTRGCQEPARRVEQARELLGFLLENAQSPASYAGVLKEEANRMLRFGDGSLYHDPLAEINTPVYFHEFAERAGRYGLQYLSEVSPELVLEEADAPEKGSISLRAGSRAERVEKEQYLDFLICRSFRHTLLCRQEVRLEASLRPDRMQQLHVAACLEPLTPGASDLGPASGEFRSLQGATITTDHPAVKRAFIHLKQAWPASVPYSELAARALREGLDADGRPLSEDPAQPDALSRMLLRCYTSDLVYLHVFAPRLAASPGERPCVSALARLQVRQGTDLTNLHHACVRIEDDVVRQLLLLMDGTRDRPALLEELTARVLSQGGMQDHEGELTQDPERVRALLAEGLEPNLQRTAHRALLLP